jgi:hypothetical protein
MRQRGYEFLVLKLSMVRCKVGVHQTDGDFEHIVA